MNTELFDELEQGLKDYLRLIIEPRLDNLLKSMPQETYEEPLALVAGTKGHGNLQEDAKDPPSMTEYPDFWTKVKRNTDEDFGKEWATGVKKLLVHLKSFPEHSQFYGAISKSEQGKNKKTIDYQKYRVNQRIVYQVVQDLTNAFVLTKIKETKGRLSLFIIIYNESLIKLSLIYSGQDSIEVDGATINSEESLSRFIAPDNEDSYYTSTYNKQVGLLKQGIAEGLGALFLQKNFNLNQWDIENLINNKAIEEHPIGVSDFPDFIIYMKRIPPSKREAMYATLGLSSDVEHLLVDTKSTTSLSKGSNYRLRYPRVKGYETIAKAVGIQQPLFTKEDNPPDIHLTRPQLDALMGFAVSQKPYETYEDERINAKMKDIVKILSKKNVILYQDVGADAGWNPIYKKIEIPEAEFYIWRKISKVRYVVLHGTDETLGQIISLSFYMGQSIDLIDKLDLLPIPTSFVSKAQRNKAPTELSKELELIGADEVDEEDPSLYEAKSPKEVKPPKEKKEKHVSNKVAGLHSDLTKTEFILEYLPFELWHFMWKWGPASLKEIKLQPPVRKTVESIRQGFTLSLLEKSVRRQVEAITKAQGTPEGIELKTWNTQQISVLMELAEQGYVEGSIPELLANGIYKRFAEVWADIGWAIRFKFPQGFLQGEELYMFFSQLKKKVLKELPYILGRDEEPSDLKLSV